MPCVVCDKAVVVDARLWGTSTSTVAVCRECFETVQRPVIRQLFILRKQVRQIHEECRQASLLATSLKEDVADLHQEMAEKLPQ